MKFEILFIVKVLVMQPESDLYPDDLHLHLNEDCYTIEYACVLHDIWLKSLYDLIKT